MHPDTFPALLADLLTREPGRPLLTAYDEASGERTELSVTTYANWVAKTANLLADEYSLEDRDTMRLDLPPHWLTAVFLGAAWSAGVAVTTDAQVPATLVVTGPDGVASATGPTLACSLRPFAVRFTDPLPAGVDDFGLAWPGQPDAFTPFVPPDGATTAWRDAAATASQADLLSDASDAGLTGARVITDADPAATRGVSPFLAALVGGGSLVLVAHPADDGWPARLEGERATTVVRGAEPPQPA